MSVLIGTSREAAGSSSSPDQPPVGGFGLIVKARIDAAPEAACRSVSRGVPPVADATGIDCVMRLAGGSDTLDHPEGRGFVRCAGDRFNGSGSESSNI